MKQSLLISLALLGSGAVAGAQSLPAPARPVGHEVTLQANKATKAKAVKRLNPNLAAEGNNVTLFESFEREDDTDRTFPADWTTKNTNENDWYVYMAGKAGITAPDGNYVAVAACFTPHDESWLISPEITPNEGEQLMFDLYFDVRALYEWTTTGDNKNVDEEDGLILNRVNAENMKICVSVDGGEWIVLKNLWDEYGKLGYYDIMYDYDQPEFRHFALPLDAYAGKKVKIGFCHQYLNKDFGYGMFLDAVRVSLPPVKPSYQLPFGMLFFGMSNEIDVMPLCAIAPAHTELTWLNDLYGDDLSFNWEHYCFSNFEPITSTESDFVTTYKPDYTENPESNMTIYSFPKLTATNGAGTSGEYAYGDESAMVIVTPEAALATRDGGKLQFGMSTYDMNDGYMIYNADFSTPAWGKSAMTTDWWTDHMFRGEPGEGDKVEVTSNMNFFYTNGAPIVVEGVRVFASTVCEPDAEFKMQLISLNDEFVMENTLATATLTGADLIPVDVSLVNFSNVYVFDFKFDAPVVIENCNFVARISGINSEKVSYYAPIQSYDPAPLCYAFVSLDITAPSLEQYETLEQLMPATLEDDYMGSFAMFLSASYPWLQADETEFEATQENNSKEFVLDSSYPVNKLTASNADGGEMPQWLTIEKNGQYGASRFKVTVTDGSDKNESANITLSAPGVSKTFTIKRGNWSAGVDNITVNSSAVVETQWFDLSGRRLSNEPLNGIFVTKNIHADGSVTVNKSVK